MKSEMELKMELLSIMLPGETVTRAMRRISNLLNSNKKKAGSNNVISKKNQLSTSTTANNVDMVTEDANVILVDNEVDKANRKVQLERLTEISDELLSFGLSGVYEMSYEAIEATAVRWEYQGQDGQLHGPYTAQEIASWKAAGYFSGENAVMMRKVGVVGVQWSDVSTKDQLLKSNTTETVKKNRVVFDGDNDDEDDKKRSQKRVKFDDSTPSNRIETSQDLLDDLDDDDDNDDKDADTNNNGKNQSTLSNTSDSNNCIPNHNSSSDSNNMSSTSHVEDYSSLQRGPWVSSEEQDFGVYVDLGEKLKENKGDEDDEDDDGDEEEEDEDDIS